MKIFIPLFLFLMVSPSLFGQTKWVNYSTSPLLLLDSVSFARALHSIDWQPINEYAEWDDKDFAIIYKWMRKIEKKKAKAKKK